jgi:dTDP-4-dehydrorhamnose 3,5-epimerase
MQIQQESMHFGAVRVLVPEAFEDHRGFFTEVFRKDQLVELGVDVDFVQFNHSGSVQGVLRGLHFQWAPPMGKLMRVTRGTAFLVAVDIRKESPTLGQWVGVEASAQNRKMVWAPASFARGFYVLSDFAEIQYFCTGIYNNKAESGIRWNDPEIGLDWNLSGDPTLSEKDEKAQTLAEWLERPESGNFVYSG